MCVLCIVITGRWGRSDCGSFITELAAAPEEVNFAMAVPYKCSDV